MEFSNFSYLLFRHIDLHPKLPFKLNGTVSRAYKISVYYWSDIIISVTY